MTAPEAGKGALQKEARMQREQCEKVAEIAQRSCGLGQLAQANVRLWQEMSASEREPSFSRRGVQLGRRSA